MAGHVALVHKDEGTSYGVSFPDVPGCISAGDTLDEALADAAEALAGHLALMREDGDTIPTARGLDAIKADPEFVGDLAGATAHEIAPAIQSKLRHVSTVGRAAGRRPSSRGADG